ncbi:hypothetical protein C8R44DRAFT_825981 [Mycena epipterygia]|nr:hypothetical protein C8R44DRAFT_825981 [Mycena epipterygia]
MCIRKWGSQMEVVVIKECLADTADLLLKPRETISRKVIHLQRAPTRRFFMQIFLHRFNTRQHIM